jgi:predicted regulator of Ras-like GTPase activity (Roadblock/LC7/MglB family)
MSTDSRAQEAIADLLDVSPQVEHVVIATRAGEVIAHSMGERDSAATSFAQASLRIVEQAEAARLDLDRDPVTQCEIATGSSHIFVVTDTERFVSAITPVDPTVGLVFYDLKTVLRTLRERSPHSSNGTAPPSAASKENGAPAAAQEADEPKRGGLRRRRRRKGAGA